ncbi:Na+/H+ antiporter NhaC family protein [Hoylesella loescheii]|uniref:Na+/H+ antiporter NhaC family protein n=1 Tax=Hoylesella loescheii TaxID=840 RepID=UPI0028ED477A|nr:Na+/H+ antiporter NhaC family protein [Hoylesella loescheii]
MHHISNKKGLLALSPLIVFIVMYLVTSIVAGDFYKIPITVAFMISSMYAIATSTGKPLAERINVFSKGASTNNMMLMLWIFVLAGAFANSAKEMGSIDAMVNFTLNALPSNLLLPGIFLAACLISLSIGTSVGTIVALIPIAVGIAQNTGVSLPLMAGIVVGGSFFGDNLSFISDTTVAATNTQGCRMKDKFLVNIYIVLPAAIAIIAIYTFLGFGVASTHNPSAIQYLNILPYILVIVTAIFGMNVMAVLTIGIAMTGIIGIWNGAYDLFGWFHSMGEGIVGMGELIIITMLAGGLLEIIRMNGGVDYVINKLTARINGKRGVEGTIALLVSLVDVCTANNTVAILTVGGIAKDISQRYGIDSRKSASILDTMSCCIQGIIPYGAQLLMAAGLAKINPAHIVPYLYYPFAIGFVTILAIVFRYPKKYS